MSGSAGLAAAKRRRAATATAPPPPKPKPTRTTLQSSPSSETTTIQTPSPTAESKLTPLQALNQHETRIKELEETTAGSGAIEELSKEVTELKQTILKMQTFAIEQSLEITKLKKSTEANSSVKL